MYFIDNARPDINKYNKVIDALKREPLGEVGIIRDTGLTQTPVRVIVNDLMDQGIIIKTEGRRKIYEYRFGAPPVDYSLLDEYRGYKIEQLNKMIEYINGNSCRMAYLCNYLGDRNVELCEKCDRCNNENIVYNYSDEKQVQVKEFYDSFHPVIELEASSEKDKPLDQRKSKLTNGVAFSYYGTTSIGKTVHKCKYEAKGDFPDYIIKGMVKTIKSFYGEHKFDIIMYVPPTESGDLVKNLAIKIGKKLSIPIDYGLIKTRESKPQKEFENSYQKKDNIKNIFVVDVHNEEFYKDKRVLLIDDVCDSKATLREIGRMLTKLEVAQVSPVVIAKTVGGEEI